MSEQDAHRLDGFDPDGALGELRRIAAEVSRDDGRLSERTLSGHAERMAILFDLLDHWLIVGERPPAEWRWPEPGVMAERFMRRYPRRTTRAGRSGGSRS